MTRSSFAMAVIMVLSGTVGCDKNTGTPVVQQTAWRSDANALQRMMPFLGSVESCKWKVSDDVDRAGGMVPGPSRTRLRGYALLSDDAMAALRRGYSWDEAVDGGAFLKQTLPEGERFSGAILESHALERRLPGESTYHQGRIILVPETRIVCFELFKN